MNISYDRIDEFERECETKSEFKAFLEAEDYDTKTVAALLTEYGYD